MCYFDLYFSLSEFENIDIISSLIRLTEIFEVVPKNIRFVDLLQTLDLKSV